MISMLLAVSCRPDEPAVKNVNLEVDTLLTISNSQETVLGSPYEVVTDSEGKIIALDRAAGRLVVFNEKGEFLYNIGKRGPGPAEFRDVMGMGIDDDDNIIVFDRAAQSFKKFNTDGEFIGTVTPEEPITTPVEFYPSEKRNLLLYINTNYGAGASKLLNVHSQNFEEIYSSSMKVTDFVDFTTPEPLFLRHSGNFLYLDKHYALFSPYIYNGELYKLKFNPGSSKYQTDEKFEGISFMKNVTFVRGTGSAVKVDSRPRTADGAYEGIKGVIRHNTAHGIYRLNHGHVLHFTFIEKDGVRTFGAEIFDQNLNLIGYGKIFEKLMLSDPETVNLLQIDITWKDEDDKFYIIEWKTEPIIRVVKFSYELQ